jgi:very-short-patch-repair endonuclease
MGAIIFYGSIFLIFRFIYRSVVGYHDKKIEADLSLITLKKSFEPQEELLPYHKKEYFFTINERNFFITLELIAAQNNLLLFAKVRLEDLVQVPRYTRNILKWRGYIRSRHIDFVLCDKGAIKPICAIELDDSTHYMEESRRVDRLKNRILESAGLPLVRITVEKQYSIQEITDKIKAAVFPTATNRPIPLPTTA